MGRVLVVDDEPDMLMALRGGLEAVGHQVVLASDGRMALARVAEQVPDAVVLDLLMPVLDGLQVLEDLERRADGIPVIVLLTGPESAADGRRAFALGAVGFAVKPVVVDQLCRDVADVLALDGDSDRAAYRAGAALALDALG